MTRTKRALALLLTLAMVLSFMVLPTNAAAPCTLSLSNAEATVTASEGQDVTVDVNISGLAAGEGWAALTLYIYYDPTVLTYKKQALGDNYKAARDAIQDEGGSVSAQVAAGKDLQDANQNGNRDEMCVGIAATAIDANSDPARMAGNGTLWKLTFTVVKEL